MKVRKLHFIIDFLSSVKFMLCIAIQKCHHPDEISNLDVFISHIFMTCGFQLYFIRISGSENYIRVPERDPNVRISELRMTSLQ